MKIYVRCLGIALIAVITALGQWSGGAPGEPGAGPRRDVIVRGEITSSAPLLGSWMVELASHGAGVASPAFVNPDGTFELRAPASGIYELLVSAGSGGVVYRQYIVAGDSNQPLSIRLPEPGSAGTASRSDGNTVSVHQLTHKVPAAAQKAFNKGQKAVKKGNHEEAAKCFLEAVTIDPEFTDAYNDLGASQVELGRLAEAAEAFQKVIDIEPDHPLGLHNLSIVLAKMHRFREAGETARRALQRDPSNAEMHLILADCLMIQGGNPAEALANLQRAESRIPKAHLLAAHILADTGKPSEAVGELRNYLLALPADDAQRPQLETWLAQLEKQSNP
ncbi:MAG TPA: tetratricopeptide repeat protein [Bryobacteraceae bacterium]|nr:tetratricopeptide repeat protein [Bryobacteraceae bacterium]